ncbi:hypothetical protein SANTM175S_10145 [Streptomyces antimycoticus]
MTWLATTSIDDLSFGLLIVLIAVSSLGVFVFGVSAISGRLLGIRVGPLRALGAGLVGLGAMLAFKPTMHDQQSMGVLYGVQVGVSVLAAMAALVLAEVFLPRGSWAIPMRLWRAMRSRLRRTRRYSQISRIFMRHGLSRPLRSRHSLERALRPGEFGERMASGFSSLARGAAHEFLSALPMLRRLPRRAERIGASLEEGRFTVRVRVLADERERRFVSGLIHQLTVTLLAACTGLMGVVLVVFGTGRGPQVTAEVELFPLLGYQVLAVSAILMLRALYTAIRRPGTHDTF